MTSPAFRQLRLAEIADSIALLRRYKPSGDLLEIGAGTGWQSKALAQAGYVVTAVDLPVSSEISNHARNREWPITDYDGRQLPFPDASFDLVYSSNVLEHVEDIATLTDEMKRVLRGDGLALHLLPNSNWRLLSLATYYPAQAVDLGRWLGRSSGKTSSAHEGAGDRASPSFARKALARLIPGPHGSVGTAIGELRRFSKASWDTYFREGGWDIIEYRNNGLLASGDYLLGQLLPTGLRRSLGRITGGIAHVYLVRPRP